jgi:hypothetical protein
MNRDPQLLEQAEALQNLLVSRATGGATESDAEYRALRSSLIADSDVGALAPRFLRTCRTLFQFWQFIKSKFSTYQERREFLWAEFHPLLDFLEGRSQSPADEVVSGILASFDVDTVYETWRKALERRASDPEGAITVARTLLETVCKHILDEGSELYDEKADLPELYSKTAKILSMAPSQHSEPLFKQVLGGCHSVVQGLGALRNRLSDAHGKGKRSIRPAPRHAELAVNLAGSMATFLVATWDAQKNVT